MKIENLIFRSVYAFPSLYYKSDWQETRRAVLRHMFLTLGNGQEFVKHNGLFVYKSDYPFPKGKSKEIKQKLLSGMPLYEVRQTDNGENPRFGILSKRRVFPSLQSRMIEEKDVHFEDEFDKGDKLEFYSDVLEGSKIPDLGYYKYPNKKQEEMENRYVSPYPFCFYYLDFVEINPNYEKYDYYTVDNMTVEELRESKVLIPVDYSAAIVEIYKWALEFYKDDEKFLKDNHYNWKPDDRFKKLYSDAEQTNESWSKFCKDYGHKDERRYPNVFEYVKDRVNDSRVNYISNSEKIIAAFS